MLLRLDSRSSGKFLMLSNNIKKDFGFILIKFLESDQRHSKGFFSCYNYLDPSILLSRFEQLSKIGTFTIQSGEEYFFGCFSQLDLEFKDWRIYQNESVNFFF